MGSSFRFVKRITKKVSDQPHISLFKPENHPRRRFFAQRIREKLGRDPGPIRQEHNFLGLCPPMPHLFHRVGKPSMPKNLAAFPPGTTWEHKKPPGENPANIALKKRGKKPIHPPPSAGKFRHSFTQIEAQLEPEDYQQKPGSRGPLLGPVGKKRLTEARKKNSRAGEKRPWAQWREQLKVLMHKSLGRRLPRAQSRLPIPKKSLPEAVSPPPPCPLAPLPEKGRASGSPPGAEAENQTAQTAFRFHPRPPEKKAATLQDRLPTPSISFQTEGPQNSASRLFRRRAPGFWWGLVSGQRF
jgi:hypothetical protein